MGKVSLVENVNALMVSKGCEKGTSQKGASPKMTSSTQHGTSC